MAEHWGASSGMAALAVAMVPLFTLLFSQLFGQRNTALEWGGVVLKPFGIVLFNLGSDLQTNPAGAGLILFVVTPRAFGSVQSQRLLLSTEPMVSAAEMLIGGAVLLVGSLVSGERLEHWPSTSGWLTLIYLIPFDSIIAFSAYQYLLRNVRPATTTGYAYVDPAVAMLLGTLFAGERIGDTERLAMLMIINAMALISLPQWRVSRVTAWTS